MEANRLRRGMKAKLGLSFYRAPKPSSMPYSSMVKTPPSSSMASLGFIVEENGFTPHPPNRKASMPKKEGGDRLSNQISSYSVSSTTDQDSVDNKAAKYISYVQERFRLEQIEYDK